MQSSKLTKDLKGTIVFNETDWLSGLNPQYQTSLFLNLKGNKLTGAKGFDPYRFYGFASPGFLATSATNVSVVDAVQTEGIVNSSKLYTVGGAKLQETTIANAIITTPTTFPHSITSAVSAQSLAIYYINASGNRNKYLFYSYNTSGGGNIGVYDFATSFTDAWLSTVPANASTLDTTNDHPLVVGVDDCLYVGDGNNVHKIDGVTGTNSTLTKNILTIPKDYIITSFARLQPRTLVVFAYKGSSGATFNNAQTTAFFWDYVSKDPYNVVDLNDNFVRGGFTFQTTIGCFTQGRTADKTSSHTSKLQLWDGSQFKVIKHFYGDIPFNGGVDVVGNQILWNSNGQVYAYGNNLDDSLELNNIAAGSGTTSGIIISAGTNRQYISSGVTTSGGLQYINAGYYEQGQVATLLVRPSLPIGYTAKIDAIGVNLYKASTSGVNFTIVLSDEAGNTIAQPINDTGTFSSPVNVYYRNYDGTEFEIFDALKAVIIWSSGINNNDCPVVDNIQINYSLQEISF